MVTESMSLGSNFEREIREQPAVWEAIAASECAERLARTIAGNEIVLLGSGSSLNVAHLGALALRRRGIGAQALASTEARLDHNAYLDRTVIAISQSGASSDVLAAIELLRPRTLIALTNTSDSPLGARAALTIDVGAGVERAVPATKSVTATAAILLWAASLVAGDGRRHAAGLQRIARDVRAWFASPALASVVKAAALIAERTSVAILGSDYGFPIAREAGLKLKEACYLHAEGFAAGEFRHGSIAMVDASFAVIGIVDDDAFTIVERPLRELDTSDALRYTIGTRTLDGIPRLGPEVEAPFNTLAWLVTIQTIALYAARERGIDGDAPRGLSKALIDASTPDSGA